MTKPVSKTHAKRNTLLAQGSALLLAGVAVGVVLVGPRLLSEPESDLVTVEKVMAQRQAERERVESATPAADETTSKAEVDLDAVAQRLAQLVDIPKPADTTQVTAQGETQREEQVVTNTQLKYLGSIVEPNRKLALLSLNGIQRIVPLGSEANFTLPEGTKVTLRVVGVSDSEVMIERDGARERVAKADRVSQAVTLVQNVGPQPGQPGQPGAQQAQPNPQESEIDRRRREAEDRRQRILDRQRQDNGGRRPDFEPGGRPDGDEPQK